MGSSVEFDIECILTEARTDTFAEIQNTLQAGTDVKLREVESAAVLPAIQYEKTKTFYKLTDKVFTDLPLAAVFLPLRSQRKKRVLQVLLK